MLSVCAGSVSWRARHRPWDPEKGMSQMKLAWAMSLFVLTAAFSMGSASAQTLGVVGGSLHDEAQGVIDFASVGWSEQLVEAGIVDIGVYEPDPTVRWEPRYDGYGYNWARGGASAMSPTFRDLAPDDPRFKDLVPFSVQIEGLAQQIAAGEIDIAFIGIGGNDVTIWQLLGGSFSGPEFEAFSARLVDAIFAAVTAFQRAGDAAIVVATLPTAPDTPLARATANASINAAIRTRAAELGVAVLDLYGFVDDPRRITRREEVRVGPYRIPLTSVATASDLVAPDSPDASGPCQLVSGLCSTRQYNLNFLLHDDVHPTTAINGLIANEFVSTVRRAYHIWLRKLSDREILAAAGLSCH